MHNAPTPSAGFEPWEIETVEAVVRDFLSTRQPSALLQLEDLVQEVLLHWWMQRVTYQAERGASAQTYLRRLARGKLIDLEREQRAAKRGGGRQPLSLDQPIGEEERATLGSLLEAPQEPGRMEAALQRALARLNSRQKRVVEALQATDSRSEAAEKAGISRDTLYTELNRVVEVFRDEGLEEFLY